MAERQEDKYLIWKTETLDNLCELDPAFREAFKFLEAGMREARKAEGKNRFNRYIICNQDEPYAEKVWQVILEGEDAKSNDSKSPAQKREEKPMKLMYRATFPTHGGKVYHYYTAKDSRSGQHLGQFKTVEEAVAATGRAFAGECDDSWYDILTRNRFKIIRRAT